MNENEERIREQVGATVGAYLKATLDLLAGQFASLKEFAPRHMTDPGDVEVMCCHEGVVVRYMKKQGSERKLKVGWAPNSLKEVLLHASNGFAYLLNKGDEVDPLFTGGLRIEMLMGDIQPNQITRRQDMGTLFLIVRNELPDKVPLPPSKPLCLASFLSTFDFHLGARMVPVAEPDSEGQPFLIVDRLSPPFPWECIEVYPSLDLNHWKPDYASQWAQTDILGAVAVRGIQDKQMQGIDRNREARKTFSTLLTDFKALLDSNPEREETLQQFLKDHPHLLSPAHTQCWPKLKLGTGNTGTDFVFREPVNDYLLVEIERSTLKLFREDGQPSADLTHAQFQVSGWKRYIADNLSTVRQELRLDGISSNPRSLIVMGRSMDLTDANRRILGTMETQNPTQKIMTYDDVLTHARSVIENLLGPIPMFITSGEIYLLPRGTAVPDPKYVGASATPAEIRVRPATESGQS